MNKIKVIDLLNMISKGEEVPKKIKYKGHMYHYQYKDTKEANIINYYHSDETHHHLIDGGWHDIRLNDEVEIIEEKKLPEKIDLTGYWDKNSLRTEEWCFSEELIGVKINEILDYLESKEKGDE